MLTKADLSKIQKIINPIGKDLNGIKKDVSGLKQDVGGLKQNVKQMGKKLDTVIDFFDRQNIGVEKRLSRVEKTLHLPQPADF